MKTTSVPTLITLMIPKRIRQVIGSYAIDFCRQEIMPTPGRVIIAGWPGSGSTFVFQVAKLLGLDVRKVHGSWNYRRMDRVIFTIRDPRDVVCSTARRRYAEDWKAGEREQAVLKSLEGFLDKHYVEDLLESAAQPNVIIVRYETFFGRSEDVLIQMLADQFMVSVDDQKITSILAETSLESNLKRAHRFESFQDYDRDTYIHGRHITNRGRPGAWKHWFTPAVDAVVKRSLGDVLVQLGYEQDTGWSSSGFARESQVDCPT